MTPETPTPARTARDALAKAVCVEGDCCEDGCYAGRRTADELLAADSDWIDLLVAERVTASADNETNAAREEFCDVLGPDLADAMEAIGIEDADLTDGRALADTVFCLGYRRLTPSPTERAR